MCGSCRRRGIFIDAISPQTPPIAYLATWKNTADVKQRFATASIVSAERIVFNIKGNAYRLVVAVDFDKAIVWIKWIGTHKADDKIDVTKVRHGK